MKRLLDVLYIVQVGINLASFFSRVVRDTKSPLRGPLPEKGARGRR